MSETTTQIVELPIRGDGTALELLKGTGTFSLASVEIKPRAGSEKASVMWTPDTDNESNTTFWVRGIEGPSVGVLPEGTVTLILTYAGE